MNNRIFFSDGRYISLPFFKKRVDINVNNSESIKIGLKLYNPYSKKGEIIKSVYSKLILSIPFLTKLLSRSQNKGSFISYLEEKVLKQEVISSIYYPTIPDKLVLQLSSKTGVIIGYLKIGINDQGNQNIKNETKGIQIMISKQLLLSDYLIYSGNYESHDFLLVKNIDGETLRSIKAEELDIILESLKTEKTYLLNEHPGFRALIEKCNSLNQTQFVDILDKIGDQSIEKYSLVYQHGDLALWNMFKGHDGKIHLFDFEYFSNEGIEYIDLFNFHYQAAKLLMKKSENELISDMRRKIKIKEFDKLFVVFLVHRIILMLEENSDVKFETQLLNLVIKLG